MDPVNGSNAKGRKPIGMCCLHVDDLFMTGNPRVSGEVQEGCQVTIQDWSGKCE